MGLSSFRAPLIRHLVSNTMLGTGQGFAQYDNHRPGTATFPERRPPMLWIQRTIELPPRPRGFHLVTREVASALPELAEVASGLLHVFIQHTSASLTINENADPDVPVDLESFFSQIAPEGAPYRHT
jgi:hypothetical protein